MPQQKVRRLASRDIGISAPFGQRAGKLVVIVANPCHGGPAGFLEIREQACRGNDPGSISKLPLEFIEPKR